MKRRLNLKGKVLVTSLTIMLSVVIYVLMGFLGGLTSDNGFIQLGLVCGWFWLLFGQLGAYMLIWK
jgi:hypothetical protein